VQHVAKSFVIRTMWSEATVGFAERADQRTPVLGAKFYISVGVGVIKSDCDAVPPPRMIDIFFVVKVSESNNTVILPRTVADQLMQPR